MDGHTLTVDWDDPNNATDSTFTIPALRDAAGVATLNVGDMFSSSTDSAVLTITSINGLTGQVGFTVQHQYLDDGLAPGNNTASDTSTIGVTVLDDDTQSGSDTEPVLVKNVAPTVSLNVVPDINEHGTATLTGTYTDIGLLDGHTLTVDWDDPNNATDATFTIPAIRDAAGVATLNVGDTFNSSTDAAVLTITSVNTLTGQVAFSVQHQYLDDGLAPGNNTASDTSTIGVTVADDDTQSGSDTEPVLVKNVAPTVSLNVVPDINENGTATLTGTYTDIGLLDGHTLTVDWDDPNNATDATFAIPALRDAAGVATLAVNDTFNSSTDSAVLTITSINGLTGQVAFSVQHQYLDDGLAPGNNTASDTSTIGVTVADDDTLSDSKSTMLTVHNVMPILVNTAGTTIVENSDATIAATILDPGTLDVFSVAVNWQDGSTANIVGLGLTDIPSTTIGDTTYTWNAATRRLTLTHHYGDDNPTGTASDAYPVSLLVADDDTGTGTFSITVVVNNVAPMITAVNVSPLTINESESLTLNGTFTDRSITFATETYKAFVIWGDGESGGVRTEPLDHGAELLQRGQPARVAGAGRERQVAVRPRRRPPRRRSRPCGGTSPRRGRRGARRRARRGRPRSRPGCRCRGGRRCRGLRHAVDAAAPAGARPRRRRCSGSSCRRRTPGRRGARAGGRWRRPPARRRARGRPRWRRRQRPPWRPPRCRRRSAVIVSIA